MEDDQDDYDAAHQVLQHAIDHALRLGSALGGTVGFVFSFVIAMFGLSPWWLLLPAACWAWRAEQLYSDRPHRDQT